MGFSVNLGSPSSIAYRDSPEWPGWSSHRSAPLACFTIRAPTTMRAGLLPAPLCRFFSRLLYSCSILSQGRLSASFTQRLGLAQTRETLEAQTARNCGIGSSISCRFLLVLTPKGNHSPANRRNILKDNILNFS